MQSSVMTKLMHDFTRLYIPAANPEFPCRWVSPLSTSKLGSDLSSFHIPCFIYPVRSSARIGAAEKKELIFSENPMCSPRHEARMNGNIGSIHQDVGGGGEGRGGSEPLQPSWRTCVVCAHGARISNVNYISIVCRDVRSVPCRKKTFIRYRIKYTH